MNITAAQKMEHEPATCTRMNLILPQEIQLQSKLLFYPEMDKLMRKLREQNEVGYKEDWQKLEKYLTKKWGTKSVSWNPDHY